MSLYFSCLLVVVTIAPKVKTNQVALQTEFPGNQSPAKPGMATTLFQVTEISEHGKDTRLFEVTASGTTVISDKSPSPSTESALQKNHAKEKIPPSPTFTGHGHDEKYEKGSRFSHSPTRVEVSGTTESSMKVHGPRTAEDEDEGTPKMSQSPTSIGHDTEDESLRRSGVAEEEKKGALMSVASTDKNKKESIQLVDSRTKHHQRREEESLMEVGEENILDSILGGGESGGGLDSAGMAMAMAGLTAAAPFIISSAKEAFAKGGVGNDCGGITGFITNRCKSDTFCGSDNCAPFGKSGDCCDWKGRVGDTSGCSGGCVSGLKCGTGNCGDYGGASGDNCCVHEEFVKLGVRACTRNEHCQSLVCIDKLCRNKEGQWCKEEEHCVPGYSCQTETNKCRVGCCEKPNMAEKFGIENMPDTFCPGGPHDLKCMDGFVKKGKTIKLKCTASPETNKEKAKYQVIGGCIWRQPGDVSHTLVDHIVCDTLLTFTSVLRVFSTSILSRPDRVRARKVPRTYAH